MEFILKPVFWNVNNYKKPSGHRVTGKSFPAMYGYGHEEWNGSDKLKILWKGSAVNVFHIEQNSHIGGRGEETIVFMYASHDGVQELVGVAAKAQFLDKLNDRKKILKQIGVTKFKRELWDVNTVKKSFRNEKKRFNQHCNENLSWIPNWISPQNYFLWLEKPVKLNAQTLANKQKFLTLYSRYERINGTLARVILDLIPNSQRNKSWQNISDLLIQGDAAILSDLDVIYNDTSITITDRESLIKARVGQGKFRQNLLEKYKYKCSVTGCDIPEALRASHIKAWRDSTNKQRLDTNNGLLLVGTLDLLFDAGLISFNDEGIILITEALQKNPIFSNMSKKLLEKPSSEQVKYLKFHREINGFSK